MSIQGAMDGSISLKTGQSQDHILLGNYFLE